MCSYQWCWQAKPGCCCSNRAYIKQESGMKGHILSCCCKGWCGKQVMLKKMCLPLSRPAERSGEDVDIILARLKNVKAFERFNPRLLQEICLCGFYECLEKGITCGLYTCSSNKGDIDHFTRLKQSVHSSFPLRIFCCINIEQHYFTKSCRFI